MPSFDDVRLPDNIEQGSTGGPGFQTTVISLSTGYEQRNVDWPSQRCAYDISYGVQNQSDFNAVRDFFYARQGRARGFRFKDWSDFQAVGTNIGLGDGSTLLFQLRKQYINGGVTYNRKITRPVAGTVNIYKAGVLQTSGVSVNLTTGLVTFTVAPGVAQAITADFEFDVPVRFDTDRLKVIMQGPGAFAIDTCEVVEVRE